MGGKSGLDFGLGLKSRTDFLGSGLVKRAVGAAVGGAAIGLLGASQGFKRITASGEQATGKKRALNTLTGLGTGMFRGVTTGAKGGKIGANLKNAYKTQVGASAATNKYIAAGGDSFKERLSSSISREIGFPTAYDRTMAEVVKKPIKITETILRDAHQSLIATRMTTEQMLPIVDKLDKVRGFVKTEETKELAEDARIELSQGIEVVTSYSKMLKSIKETFESVINMDSNTYINRLTMWNIILVVPTVIVGYYGMNMQLPFAEYAQTATVIFVLIMILLLGFALFSLIRRRVV